MKTLICPVSPLRVNRSTVRITGLLMAVMIALYALTSNITFIALIVFDYLLRAWTPAKYSPFSWLAQQVVDGLRLPSHQQDKAPKIFAARVGFLFALTTLLLYPLYPVASLIIGLTLMGFALLESLLDVCVGCLVYTYIVWPLWGQR